jgi:hypothetical protein
MKFIWRAWKNPPSGEALGHGICIYDWERGSGNPLIGFVEGYEWYHGRSEAVLIYMIEPDATTPLEIIQEVRTVLEKSLKPHELPKRIITSRIETWANA